jgi:antitoxin ParD1/3/4
VASKNTSVALGEHFTAFAAAQVESGRYGSMGEVIRAGLRLLEDEQRKVEALREAIREGLEGGDPVLFLICGRGLRRDFLELMGAISQPILFFVSR